MLELVDFSLSFSKTIIIKNISFKSNANQVLIFGENASGKSCLIKSLLGVIPNLIKADLKGKFKLNNFENKSLYKSDLFKWASYLPQMKEGMVAEGCFYDDLYQLEQLRVLNEPLFQNICKYSVNWNFLGKKYIEMSGGERKFSQILVCLLKISDYYILDEPFLSLDANRTQIILKLLKDYFLEKKIILGESNGHLFKKISETFKTIEVLNLSPKKQHNKILFENSNSVVQKKTILKVEKINHPYLSTRLNFELQSHNIIQVIGENGSGKTTALKIILGIVKKKEGVLIKKEICTFAYMPQEVSEYLIFPSIEQEIKSHGVCIDALKQTLILFKYELDISMYPKDLSYAQQKIFLFCLHYLSLSNVLVFDEPFSGLSKFNQDMMQSLIIKARNQGKSIIYSQHSIDGFMCDQVVQL